MKKKFVPVTKLSESSIAEVAMETAEEQAAMNPRKWCVECKSFACDYCKNALRTGKRVINNA